MRASTFALLACLVTALAGCTAPRESTTPPSNATTTPSTTTTPTGNATPAASDITFVARQSGPPGNGTTYSFEGPSEAAAGWVTIHLRNDGAEIHQAALFALGNATYAQTLAMLHDPNATNAGVVSVGGVAAASPGLEATTTVHLDAGRYLVACFVPDPTGTPHAMHGMTRELNVTNGTGASTPPTADATLTLTDYHFSMDHAWTRGTHEIAVKNAGNHTHEAVLFKLAANKTLDDLIAYFTPGSNATGAPPGVAMGLAASTDAGMPAQYANVTLTAGRYGLICFQQDAPTDPPHFAKGMRFEFEVT